MRWRFLWWPGRRYFLSDRRRSVDPFSLARRYAFVSRDLGVIELVVHPARYAVPEARLLIGLLNAGRT